jgi:excinuclease ABC subunit A
MRGYKPGRFSFNVKGGRCEACQGDGIIRIEMQFLPDVYVPCEVCHGKRYNREALEIKYKGKTIADVLDMTVEEGLDFFRHIPRIRNKLRTLWRWAWATSAGPAGHDALGGEAQRVKLSKELSRAPPAARSTSWTSRPPACTFADIQKLLRCCTAWSTRATPWW